MLKTLLRALVVGGVLWVVACSDDATLPTVPQFGHIADDGRDAAYHALETRIQELFHEGKGKGGNVENAALRHLRNINRQLDRQPQAAQSQAESIGKLGVGQFNAGNLNGSLEDLQALVDALEIFVQGSEGDFALDVVPPGEDKTVTSGQGNASVHIGEGAVVDETLLVTIQQIVEEACELETGLVQSKGCWRFFRFPDGEFNEDVEVTICVDDTGVVPPTLIPFLRIHKARPGEPIQALVATAGNPLVDCTGFDPLASVGSNSLARFASAVSGGLRALLGPQPLAASAFASRRLGGLTGSFTEMVGAVSGGTLYVGTDHEEFTGSTPPDQMAVVDVSGPSAVSTAIVLTDDGAGGSFNLNGLAPSASGTLYSGDPFSGAIRESTVGGVLLGTSTGPLDPDCCNEDLAFDGTHIWRADYGEGPLFKFLPDGTDVTSYAQTDVVGATFVGGTLWITKWSARQVGEFDPGTNTFTPKFNTTTNAGGLAYDAGNNILWVGTQGGWVEAYDLSMPTPTAIAGSAFQPFGSIPNTVDGLAFIPD